MVETTAKQLRVSELNFFEIKDNLKNYLRTKREFQDYDFDASTMSTLLDVLAVNTYHNAYYLNMVGNENFLDTAILRENVVSRAKELGYVPRSMRSAMTTLYLNFLPNDDPAQIVIPKYTRFSAISENGETLQFVTHDDYNVTPSTGGSYTKTVTVYEGIVLTWKFIYNGNNAPFQIPNYNLDSTSLRVYVKENDVTTDKTEYTLAEDIVEVEGDSTVYYLEEDYNGNWTISFGDGVLGVALETGNVIVVEGRFCLGALANGISDISTNSHIGYNIDNIAVTYTPTTIRAQSRTSGGSSRETVDSVRFSAPKYFGRQRRLVTEDDYRSFILSNYPEIDSVSVMGGEKHDPPYYGKVLVACKPVQGYTISAWRKSEIKRELAKWTVMSIDPLFVDPILTYITMGVVVHYDPTLTTLSSDAIHTLIANKVVAWEKTNLGVFRKGFYLSKFAAAIDALDGSIVSTNIDVKLEKRITPVSLSTITYKLSFNATLDLPYSGHLGTITSEPFYIAGNANQCYFDDDGNGKLRIYHYDATYNKVWINVNAGTVDYSSGTVVINSITFESLPTGASELRVYARPKLPSYIPSDNEIVLFSHPTVSIYDIVKAMTTKTGTASVAGNWSPLQTNSILTPVIL